MMGQPWTRTDAQIELLTRIATESGSPPRADKS
jgi:hypothetical protein